ncbi:MAG: Alpha/beta hydrolase fold protein [Candidatus Moranbacteria bacterium GW2011_GWF2_35_39]|nr:MAG: Alpha/beta hydrolase fold protein [Candidatus Moranbacteria bacterium GW2011_GWF2_35_39]
MLIMINKICEKTRGVLSTDPKVLYQEERCFSKEPFYFPGTNGKAVLLIHGWTSVPYEVRRLGKYLNENGYTVSGPLLRGHGTKPEDLENVRWEEWLCDVTRAYEELAKDHEKIFVAGTSMGANLTAMLAKNKANISGIILMAMPYKIKLEKISVFIANIVKWFKKYYKKFYPPTFGASTTITRLISYQSYPIKSALELYKLMKISRKVLLKVKQPCFILQSNRDHVVAKNSLEKIYEKIGSKIKEKKYVDRAYHTFISDIKNEHIFEDILNFLNKN